MGVTIKKGDKIYYTNKSLVPILGKPFIDKLFITLDIPVNQQQQVMDKFIEIFDNGWATEYSHKSSYVYNLTISDNFPDYEGAASIHCLPKNNANVAGDAPSTIKGDKIKKNFFRLECNPARVDLANLKTILDQILPGGYIGLLNKGKVNRIDLTVDVATMKVAEVIASYPKLQVAYNYGKGINSQSKYLGSPKSNQQICLYDKIAQMEEIDERQLLFPINDNCNSRFNEVEETEGARRATGVSATSQTATRKTSLSLLPFSCYSRYQPLIYCTAKLDRRNRSF